MPLIDSLRTEFAHETRTTRRLLERVPGDKLDWRPHVKSFTAGGLASHIVECVGLGGPIFDGDELDLDPKTYKPYLAATVAQVLQDFDAHVADLTRALAVASDADTMRPWRFKIGGRLQVEKSKAAAFRDFTLSHMIHHRGQLSVYLRLLDVPVPGSYGPTADE